MYGTAEGSQQLPEYLTVIRAAEFLSVHPNSVYNAIKYGGMPHVRINPQIKRSAIRIPRAALLEWMKGQTQENGN